MANLKHIKYTSEAKYNAGTKSDDTLYAVPIPKTTSGDIDSGNATNGQVLTANGTGGASWQTAGGGGTTLNKYIWLNASMGTRLYNIFENAKGHINICINWGGGRNVFYNFSPANDEIQFYMLNYSTTQEKPMQYIYQLYKSGSTYNRMYDFTVQSPTYINSDRTISRIDITYWNDTEITQ